MRELRTEVSKIDNVGLTYLVGETGEEIRIAPDPAKLALYGVTLQQLSAKVQSANSAFPAGTVRNDNQELGLIAGETLSTPARNRQSPADLARWPAGLCPRCRRHFAGDGYG